MPAKDFKTAKVALYSGADAIYCGLKKFSARAYAQNLTIDELKQLVILAHTLKKKIYVTINTIIKEDEMAEAIESLNDLYLADVDGIIVTDFALIKYILDNLPGLEVHVSTQSGVKYLDDALFFEKLGAKRVVVARENSLDEIKKIRENTKIELEVFIHGSLCVSYSGGCLFSSFLSLRSGNRGKCSQNCRREYALYKDDKLIENYSYLLSMKDLNASQSLNKLIELDLASFKVEGRMKDEAYVSSLAKFYRNIIDNNIIDEDEIKKNFHRIFTKGFLFNTSSSDIVDITKKSNEGQYVGKILSYEKNLAKINFESLISLKDRIKIEGDKDYYFTVDEIFDEKKKNVNSLKGIGYLKIYEKFNKNTKIFIMKENNKEVILDNKYKYPLKIFVNGNENEALVISTKYENEYFYATSKSLLSKSINNPLTKETLNKQFSRLNETSFYLKDVILNIDNDLFLPVSELNMMRNELINNIYDYIKLDRKLISPKKIDKINYGTEEDILSVYCFTEEQYKAAKDLDIKYIYYKNYIPYFGKYNYELKDYNLVGNYGGILASKNKEIITDYTFNVINSKAIYELHKLGVKYVTLSVEASLNALKKIVDGYQQYGNNPNLEYVVYGKYILMRLKYCPLKRYHECKDCMNHKYILKDKFDKFNLMHKDCYSYILNGRRLNLIDELDNIKKYVHRFRINFTDEDYNEATTVIKNYLEKLNGSFKTYFDKDLDTLGYFKREIE